MSRRILPALRKIVGKAVWGSGLKASLGSQLRG